MLIEEGFAVTSCDYSDKMLKSAWQTRWTRRKEPAFDNWGTPGEKNIADDCFASFQPADIRTQSCNIITFSYLTNAIFF